MVVFRLVGVCLLCYNPYWFIVCKNITEEQHGESRSETYT